MTRYKEWRPTDSYLLPPSSKNWMPEDHLVYFLLDLLPVLDIGYIERAVQGKDHRVMGMAPSTTGRATASGTS